MAVLFRFVEYRGPAGVAAIAIVPQAPIDAMCSSSDRTHDALLTLYRERFGQQVETTDAATVLSNWR